MLRLLLLSLSFLLPALSFEGIASLHSPLTLVVETERPLPPAAFAEMQRELDSLMQKSPLRIEWRMRQDLKPGESVSDLVLVRFKGSCRIESAPVVFDERGPLGLTYVSDGEVLPFTDIQCAQVSRAARSAMFGGDFGRSQTLLGRALARVVAHEVYHITRKTKGHHKTGVFKEALSGKQLISDKFNLEHH